MNTSISEDIKELIFEHGSVVIPGLGAFSSGYKSATIDSIQGQLSPPSLEITFDPNKIINDGVLLDYLKRKYQISTQDAQSRIDTFNENALQTFKNHEILVITDVGRLYKDYTDKIRFLPETTNFNQETFGLPAVQFYPVSRSKPEVTVPTTSAEILEKPIPQAAFVAEPVAATQQVFSEPIVAEMPFPESVDNVSSPLIPERPFNLNLPFDIKKIIPALAAAMVLILAFSIYLFNRNDKETPKSNRAEKAKIAEKPVTPETPKPEDDFVQIAPTSPSFNTATNPSAGEPPKEIASEKYYEDTKNPVKNADVLANTEGVVKATTPPVTNETNALKATIIIGGFGNKNNVNRLKSWIKKNNYGLYERKSGGLTVVGAEVSYKDKKELSRILKNFRSRYGDEVELMK